MISSLSGDIYLQTAALCKIFRSGFGEIFVSIWRVFWRLHVADYRWPNKGWRYSESLPFIHLDICIYRVIHLLLFGTQKIKSKQFIYWSKLLLIFFLIVTFFLHYCYNAYTNYVLTFQMLYYTYIFYINLFKNNFVEKQAVFISKISIYIHSAITGRLILIKKRGQYKCPPPLNSKKVQR